MKTLLISPLYPFPEKTHGTRYVVAKILELDVSQQCIAVCNEEDKPFFQVEEEKQLFIEKVFLKNTKKWVLFFKWMFSFDPMCVVRYRSIYKKLLEKIKTQIFDQIHICSPFLLPLVQHFPKNQVIFSCIDSFSLVIWRRLCVEKSLFKKIYLFLDFLKCVTLEKRFLKRASVVTFVSNVDIEHVKKMKCKGNFQRIFLGVDLEFFKNYQSKTSNQLLFVGNFSYFTNEQAALFLIEQVMPFLLNKLPNIQLCLVGIHPTAKMLQYQSKRIIITGFVEDIKPYLEKADLFVSPLMVGGGIKIKVLQAMAMQKVVLASDVALDGIEGLDGVHFIHVKGFDPSHWADVIDTALSMKEKKIIGQEAKNLIEKKHSWKVFFEQYGMIYESIADK